MNELKIENQWIWKEMEAKWMNYMYMIGKNIMKHKIMQHLYDIGPIKHMQ